MSLKLKSPFAGKKQVVIWRLAFAEGMLTPGLEWKHLEDAFLQSTSVLPGRGGCSRPRDGCVTGSNTASAQPWKETTGISKLHQETNTRVLISLQKGGPGGFSMRAAAAAEAHPRCS